GSPWVVWIRSKLPPSPVVAMEEPECLVDRELLLQLAAEVNQGHVDRGDSLTNQEHVHLLRKRQILVRFCGRGGRGGPRPPGCGWHARILQDARPPGIAQRLGRR